MKTVNVNHVELALVDRGRGMPIVLLHGFPLDHAMWDAQVESLCADYRVVAPDLRGFGRSGLNAHTVGMEQFADDVAALLDALQIAEPIALCGLSMGGYVALQFWRKYASRVRGLILCDTRAVADTPEAAAGRRETAARVLREGPASLAECMLPKLLTPQTREQRPEVAESLRRTILAADPQAIAAAAYGMADRPDARPLLGEITCPTLVVVGQWDVISPPEEMRAIAGAIPHACVVEIAAAGHMSPMEKPAEVTAALRAFLANI